jgi:hypothetical protein
MMLRLLSLLLFGLAPALVGCGQPAASPPAPSPSAKADTPGFVLTSPAFKNDEAIPTKYTGDGDRISPQLNWTGVPPKTRGYALIMDDPDAPSGTFTHWVIYGLPPEVLSLPENVPHDEAVSSLEAMQGRNSARELGYFPPSPPPGQVHHYTFHLYALDAPTNLHPGTVTANDLRRAIDGHVLATAELTGTYQRTR